MTETCHPENPFQLIVKVQTEPNNTDDAVMLAEGLAGLTERTDVDEMHTDGGYNSPEVDKLMHTQQVQQIQTAIRGRQPAEEKLGLEDFAWQANANDGQPESVTCSHGRQAEITIGRKEGCDRAALGEALALAREANGDLDRKELGSRSKGTRPLQPRRSTSSCAPWTT